MTPILLVAVFAFTTVKNGKYKEYISGIDLIGVFWTEGRSLLGYRLKLRTVKKTDKFYGR